MFRVFLSWKDVVRIKRQCLGLTLPHVRNDGAARRTPETRSARLAHQALRLSARQRVYRPPDMVVVLYVFLEQTVQVPFTEHDNVIKQLSA